MDEHLKHKELTEKIIGCFYNVYNRLGYGFLEKVYENALILELTDIGLKAQKQMPIKVYYDGTEIGNYFADIIVNELVIIEIKACKDGFIEEHEAQLTNYLRASQIEIGLLLNFGLKAQVKRRVFSNEYKQHKNSNYF